MGTKHVLKLSKEGRGPDTQQSRPTCEGAISHTFGKPRPSFTTPHVWRWWSRYTNISPHMRGGRSHTPPKPVVG